MSSKKNEKPLKELVNQMLRAYGLGPKLDEMSLVKSWEKVVGSMIAKHTADIFFKEGKLYIELDSAPLRQELSYAKSKLVEKLNEEAEKKMVTEIIFR
jgi:predicted nucleic acid-binding Zn ribbon protein